jgi:DeoR/GlpR family transcriptional regulator of sugar metabolism
MENLEQSGKVLVDELSKELSVTTETIRRDLDHLDRSSYLKKVHGGAVRFVFDSGELSYPERSSRNAEMKNAIGRAAAALVNDGEIISIDSGTTTMCIVPFLTERKRITILTPSLSCANLVCEISARKKVAWDMVFIGGRISFDLLSSNGAMAEKFVGDFYADRAFIAAGGVSIDHGITDYGIDEAGFSRRLIERSRNCYVMIDSSKIGITSLRKIADFDEVSAIISDAECPDKWHRHPNRSLNWITAK